LACRRRREIVQKLNSDPIWVDPADVIRLVESVAGARKNSPFLIEILKKVSETRGYSALYSALESIETQIESSAFLDSLAAETLEAMARAASGEAVRSALQRRDPELNAALSRAFDAELSEFENSSASLALIVKAVAATNAILSPVEVRHAAVAATGRAREVLDAVLGFAARSSEDGPHAELAQAVDDLALFRFSIRQQLVDVVKTPSDDAIKSMLRVSFEPLFAMLRTAKNKLDVARGFEKLDRDCRESAGRPALRVFAPSWNESRDIATPKDVDAFAAAIVAGDVATLGQLIGGRKVIDIKVDCDRLPPIPRLSKNATVGLLEIASFVGGPSLRYLLEFFGMKPGVAELNHAVASGDSDTIRTIWDRIDPIVRDAHVGPLAQTAAAFHHVEVVNWLLFDAKWYHHVLTRQFECDRRLRPELCVSESFLSFLIIPVLCSLGDGVKPISEICDGWAKRRRTRLLFCSCSRRW
jgi:hypothetical protein